MIWVSTGLRLFELKFANSLCVTGARGVTSYHSASPTRSSASAVEGSKQIAIATAAIFLFMMCPPAELKVAEGNSSRKQLNTITHK
jgi:hypothetical protein